MSDQTTNIVKITRDRIDEAVEVLALAFQNYPLSKYFLSDSGENYSQHLRALFRFICDSQLILQNPPFGILKKDRLVAVACVTPPNLSKSADITEAEEILIASIGNKAINRLEQYLEVKSTYLPKEPHFYLDIIGVRPDAKKQGHGSTLLKALQVRSQVHPVSVGVCLDTQAFDNVEFYQRFGYSITTQVKLGDINIWYMFQSN